MADTIIQTMGFDAGAAIQSINALKTTLDSLNTVMGVTANIAKGFNTGSKGSTKVFDNMQKSAAALLKQYDLLAKAQAKMASARQPAGPTGGTQIIQPGSVEAQLNMIKQLTTAWGNLPARTAPALRQAFATGIAQAASFAAAQKMTAQQVVQAFATMGVGTRGKVQALGQQLAAVAATHAKAVGQIQQGNQGLVISFTQLAKVFAMRQALAGLSALISKFKEGVKAGADFSRQMGMIQTVAKGIDVSGAEQQLVNLSREFGKPLGDVASAYYLTLQNQVGDAAQSMNVLTEAMKLSVATGTDAKTTVDTLSVALNGFKLPAESAADVSGKLFKAMELGRFQFADMSDTMGRVIPIAEELGVSIEEILGPIATMTRSGVRFDTAVTQMRAVISQVLKPTERLKQIFKDEWGVENTEQAMAKFGGLMPMLKALEDGFQGNKTAAAEVFTNLRAFTGVMSVLGKNYENVIRDTQAIKDANGETAQSMYDLVKATPGQQYIETLNKINVNFALIGKTALPVINGVIGAIEKLTGALASLGGPGLATLAAFFAAPLTVAIYSQVAALWAWVAAMKGAGIVLSLLGGAGVAAALFAIGYALGTWVVNPIIAELRGLPTAAWEASAEMAKAEEAYSKRAQINASKTSQMYIDNVNSMKTMAIGALTEVNKVQDDIIASVADANEATVSTLEGTFKTLISLQEKLVSKLQTSAEGGPDMQTALKNYNKSSQAYADKEFKTRLEGADNVVKAYAGINRAQSQLSKAMGQLGTAKTQEEFDAIKEALGDAASTASDAASAAGTEKENRNWLVGARSKELQIAKALMQVDAARIQSLREGQKVALANAAIEEERLGKMKKLTGIILKGTDMFTGEAGKKVPKTEQQRAKDAQAAAVAWSELIDVVQKGKNFDPMQVLGLQDLQSKIQSAGKNLPALQTRVELEYVDQYNKMTAMFRSIPVKIRVELEGLIDPTNPIAGLSQYVTDQSEAMNKNMPEISQYEAEWQALYNILNTRVTTPLKDVIPDTKAASDTSSLAGAYQNLLVNYKALASVKPGNVEEFTTALQKAQYAMTLFEERKKTSKMSFALDTNTVEAMRLGLESVRQQFFGKIKDSPAIQLKIDNEKIRTDLQGVVAGLGFDFAKILVAPTQEAIATFNTAMGTTATNSATIATNTTTTKTNLDSAQTTSGITATNYERMATASALIKPIPGPGATPVKEALGGLMRLARGGNVFRSHGTDTVPAMLSKGEFVVNANSTRRFYSQLVAMNAGVKPVYRQDGGAVTNIGDINVSVNGSTATRQTAREIATALRREVRRGTSRL